ncbi:MAG: hypothetical protein FJ083_12510 [Cyanobacteria bacterium K_Offshore_surface_m2_239]|nr:hypothetical protein [Cyanobacteria bacterium K_Offshore_surface_m2_239]
MSILLQDDLFVPILGDFAPTGVASRFLTLTEKDNIIDALIIALAKNNIPITPLENFIAAESATIYSREIIVKIVPVSREP